MLPPLTAGSISDFNIFPWVLRQFFANKLLCISQIPKQITSKPKLKNKKPITVNTLLRPLKKEKNLDMIRSFLLSCTNTQSWNRPVCPISWSGDYASGSGVMSVLSMLAYCLSAKIAWTNRRLLFGKGPFGDSPNSARAGNLFDALNEPDPEQNRPGLRLVQGLATEILYEFVSGENVLTICFWSMLGQLAYRIFRFCRKIILIVRCYLTSMSE